MGYVLLWGEGMAVALLALALLARGAASWGGFFRKAVTFLVLLPGVVSELLPATRPDGAAGGARHAVLKSRPPPGTEAL